jgi:hypothetical protein
LNLPSDLNNRPLLLQEILHDRQGAGVALDLPSSVFDALRTRNNTNGEPRA